MSESEELLPETGGVGQLGSKLRAARQQAGLSLRELARQLSVSPSFLSQMENGKSQPSVATLYSIAQVLEVSIDELFHTSDEPAPDGESDASSSGAAGDGPPPGGSRDGATQGRQGRGSAGVVSRSAMASPAEA
ncbi:helix-turn-helix domain-containing protein, partial [Nocardioides sp. P5_C9_2]